MNKISILLITIAMGTACAQPSVQETNSKENVSRHNKNLSFNFRRSEGAILRSLHVTKMDDDKIAFEILVTDERDGSSSKIDGVAVRRDGDPEVLEDSDGSVYAADQFIHDSRCWLSIDIEIEHQTKAKITESGCEKSRKLHFRYGSDQLLDREEPQEIESA